MSIDNRDPQSARAHLTSLGAPTFLSARGVTRTQKPTRMAALLFTPLPVRKEVKYGLIWIIVWRANE